ncbi:MAG: RNA polymerase sigma factor [Rhodothermales bacterium]|nr:RNA polymerase sigma factor [Rhodothermales bacterium]
MNATTATIAFPEYRGARARQSILSGWLTPAFRGGAGNWTFAREDDRQTRRQLQAANDGVLVTAAADGDRRAFRELMDRYIDDVSRTVAGMLGAGQEVDDIVQDAFIRLYRALPTFRGDASVKTYVTRIAINRSLDELRARKRRRWLRPWEEVEGQDELAGEGYASDETELDDRDRLLRQAVNTLPATQRAVVVLRMIEEYSTEETADILGIAYGTVLSRLKRGLDKLKDTLAESGYTSFSDV